MSEICNNCPHEKIDHHNADVFCCEIAEAGMFCTLCRCASFTARPDEAKGDNGHLWATDRDFPYCRNCGLVKRSDGTSNPCRKELPKITTRDDEPEGDETEAWLRDEQNQPELADQYRLLAKYGKQTIFETMLQLETTLSQLQAERSRREDAEAILEEAMFLYPLGIGASPDHNGKIDGPNQLRCQKEGKEIMDKIRAFLPAQNSTDTRDEGADLSVDHPESLTGE